LAIERCDKCGKSFMSKSEVERHKMWEHPVPISPFEDRLAVANRDVNPEDLQKLTSTVGRSSDDTAIIGGGQRRRVPFRPFRI
jgi:hypothetical protein